MFGTRPENAPELKELFAAARTRYEKGDARTVPIHFSCVCQSGQPASLTVSDEDGHAVTVSGAVPEPAQNNALTPPIWKPAFKRPAARPSAVRTAPRRWRTACFSLPGR